MADGRTFVRAKIHPKYLHSNSTSHTWAFSAIAELIDNAYDPDVLAKDCWIDKEVISGKQCLVFTDNGKGLNRDKLTKMLSLGYSDKLSAETTYHKAVGRYGNGFKSGAMRLAKDALVISVRREDERACVGLLSQTLHADHKLDELVLPMIEFSLPDLNLIDLPEQQVSLDTILEIAPYHDMEDLKKEITKLMARHRYPGEKKDGGNGTKIVLFNLVRLKMENGIASPYELEFVSGSELNSPKKQSQPGTSCQGQHEPPIYGDIRILSIKPTLQTQENNPEDAPSSQESETSTSRDGGRLDYKQSLRAYCSFLYLISRMNIYICGDKVKTESIKSMLKEPCTDKFYREDLEKKRRRCSVKFGMAPDLGSDGVMFYHKSRIIKPFVRVKCQTRTKNPVGEGVVGVVDVTDVLEPIHNKQDFETTTILYKSIMETLSKQLENYWWKRPASGKAPARRQKKGQHQPGPCNREEAEEEHEEMNDADSAESGNDADPAASTVDEVNMDIQPDTPEGKGPSENSKHSKIQNIKGKRKSKGRKKQEISDSEEEKEAWETFTPTKPTKRQRKLLHEETPSLDADRVEEASRIVDAEREEEETPIVEAEREEEVTPIVEAEREEEVTPIVDAEREEEETPIIDAEKEETQIIDAAREEEETTIVDAEREEEATPIVDAEREEELTIIGDVEIEEGRPPIVVTERKQVAANDANEQNEFRSHVNMLLNYLASTSRNTNFPGDGPISEVENRLKKVLQLYELLPTNK